MATNIELDSGIVVTRFFRRTHRVQLNLRSGANQWLTMDEVRELREALMVLEAEAAKGPREIEDYW